MISNTRQGKRPLGITVIVLINGIATILTLFFWLLIYIRVFSKTIEEPVFRAIASSTLGFLVADIFLAVPLLILSCLGLWKLCDWGWLFAQMANIVWIYSIAVVLIRDIYIGKLSPGLLLFLPFALFTIWAIAYLWYARSYFWHFTQP